MAGPGARLSRWLVGTIADEALVAAPPPVPMRAIFRRFWPYIRPHRAALGILLASVALTPVVDAATVWVYKVLVDRVLVARDFGLFPRILLAYFLLAILSGVVSFGDRYFSTFLAERFLVTLRVALFRHLHSLSPHFFARRRLGDLLSRLTGDMATLEELVVSGIVDALSLAARILVFAGVLLYLDWRLALVAFLAAPPFWLVTRHFAGLLKRNSRERQRRSGSIGAVAEESLANAAVVQAYNRQDREVWRFHRECIGKFRADLAAARLRAVFRPLIDLIELAGLAAIIAAGTLELSRGRLSVGGFLAFLFYLNQLNGPIRGLSGLANAAFAASASAERIIELLDERPAVADGDRVPALHRAAGRIAFEAVSLRYPEEAGDALIDIAFRAEPGEIVALVGPSGAGKSSIARLLLRFSDPTGGRITLDGRDLRDFGLHTLREQIAVLPQEGQVFNGTVRENIAFGRAGATEAQIARAAREADADGFIAALPAGYDTAIGEKGARLSGGQRQRVMIARAMIRDAPVLILDEPTTGLDTESARRIIEPLRRLMRGRTTIVITHDLATVREATTILVVDSGRIVERGTHEELLLGGGAYAQLYRPHHLIAPPDRPPVAEAREGAPGQVATQAPERALAPAPVGAPASTSAVLRPWRAAALTVAALVALGCMAVALGHGMGGRSGAVPSGQPPAMMSTGTAASPGQTAIADGVGIITPPGLPTGVPPVATPAPPATSPSPATLRRRIIDATAALRSGEVVIAVDEGSNLHVRTIIWFDRGDEQHAMRSRIVAATAGATGTPMIERVVIGDRAWQRQGEAGWESVSAPAGTWVQIEALLPHLAAADDAQIEADGRGVVVRWSDVARGIDVTVEADPATGIPRQMQQVARASGAVLTVTYAAWNTGVSIDPPEPDPGTGSLHAR